MLEEQGRKHGLKYKYQSGHLKLTKGEIVMPKLTKVTPKGTARYCFIQEPQTNFDPDGVYSTQLLVEASEAQELMEYMDEQLEKAKEMALKKAKPNKKASITAYQCYEEDYTDDGDPTGDIVFKFKLKATRKNKDGSMSRRSVRIVDAMRNKWDEDIIVGQDSTIKVAFIPRPYYSPSTNTYGVACYLNAVQVLELVEGGGGDPFEVEGGTDEEEDF
jgi:hypothetical protein